MPAAKLLYLEDDHEHCELMAAFLGASGFRVTTARSADEATAAMAEGRFDVVIADASMAETARLHGAQRVVLTRYGERPLDLLSRLRALPRRAP